MFDFILGVILGGILKNFDDPIDFGISEERIKEIQDESFERCFSKEFRDRIKGDVNNEWFK